jgi:hypothetical protein
MGNLLEIAEHKHLNALWVIVGFIISVLWIVDIFAVRIANFDAIGWLAIFVFWWMLGTTAALFLKSV